MADLFAGLRRLEDARCRLRVAGYVEQRSGYGPIVGWRAPDGRLLEEQNAIEELLAKEGNDDATPNA